MLERTGYDLPCWRWRAAQRRLANVRKLMRLGREHEAAHGPDLRGFLELVAAARGGERGGDPRESEAPVESEALDAVRLMTIHRAKGLEFEIVCVADLGRGRRSAFAGADPGRARRAPRPAAVPARERPGASRRSTTTRSATSRRRRGRPRSAGCSTWR